MPQRFRYNARTGELSGITSLKVGDPQVSVEEYIVNYITNNTNNARDRIYDSDAVQTTIEKSLGTAGFDSDQIVAIINENRADDDTGFDSDQVVAIINENSGAGLTGFDSDQVVAIINENSSFFDSDQVVAIIDENAPVAGFDSDQINTIIQEFSGDFRGQNPDNDSDLIQQVLAIIDTEVFGDSDRKVVSDLRNDLDSESSEIRQIRRDLDSDSIKLQQLDSDVQNFKTSGLDGIRADLDSETARIQLLLSNADSDQINIAILRRDADSDSLAIQAAVTRAENDAALIGKLRTELDSETSRIEELQDNLDSESAEIRILRSDLDSESVEIRSIRADLDSDSIKIQQNDSDIRNLYDRVIAVENDGTLTGVNARLDSDEEQLQLLNTRIDNIVSVNTTQNANIQRNKDDIDSETSRIQLMLLRIDSDELALQSVRTDLTSRLDSDETAIQNLSTKLDSESTEIRVLRSDLDSESLEIRQLRKDADSDSLAIQNLRLNLDDFQLSITDFQARLDSETILTKNLDSDVQQLKLTDSLDSDAVVNMINEHSGQGLTDSDLQVVADLRNDVDSDSIVIQDLQRQIDNLSGGMLGDSDYETLATLRNDIDSDSIKIQDIQTQIDTINTIIDSDEALLQSIESRVDILETNADSDVIDIGNLKRDADSDAAAIVIIKQNAESDAAAIQSLNTDLGPRLDSDELKLQSHSLRLDTLESRADSDETKVQSLDTRVKTLEDATDDTGFDSDQIVAIIQENPQSDAGFDSDQVVAIITENTTSVTDSDLKAISDLRNDLDSESAVISKLRADLDSEIANKSTGFDSDGIVNIINENVSDDTGFDSDQIVAIINENTTEGSTNGREIYLGTEAYDSEYQSPRAVVETFDSDTSVTSAIDQLNEAMHNVLNSTAVTNVSFTANQTSGGEGMNVTLTINADGNPNRYDIYWGDGETTDSDTSDSTPSHTYNDNTNTPFSVRVVARNNNGRGAGSFAESLRNDYIVLYGADPVASFAIYLQESGGSSINLGTTGVETEQTIWFENTTTNTTGQTATFEIEWGDGDSDSVSNSEDGGVDGNRISHTYTTDSGTGRHTIQLTLQTHGTANPSVIPLSTSSLIKVYDSEIAAPNGLSTKTISAPSSTGTSPRAASGFTDNVSGGTTINAGDSVTRTTGSGTISSSTISTYAHDAASGTLSAKVDGSTDGSKAFTTGNDSGTYTSLVVTEDIDANTINASGSTVSFASSIYAPNKYEVFKARVSKSSLSAGSHSYQLSHDATGDTNTVHFIHDDVTSTPSISSAGTLSESTAGTYRYISGIPYYNSGSPQLTLSGTTVSNISGQTYANISDPIEVESGSPAEGSGNAISNRDYTYSNIDGSTTFLSGGIPLADTGVSSAYAIGDLTVPITTSNVRVVDNLRIRGTNVNGSGSYTNITSHKVAVHTSSQYGISEIAIAVSDSLGAGYDDDAIRILDYVADSDNPPVNSSINHYTNNVYSESTQAADIDSEGQEAIIRMGTLKHDVTDFTSGYLPKGPDRSGLTGTQYFTFAFRRTQVSNFNLNITSSTGVAGVWIAVPGTTIDSASGLNGWLNCGAQYAGAGVPGSDTGNGGNGSDGCASTGSDVIGSGALSGAKTMTLGTISSSNATNNIILVRIGLDSGDTITGLSIT